MNSKAIYPANAATQRGGTFLGIVIGLMLGLALALAVAVYVTKVPMPFSNKGPTKNGAEQDAQEAQKNKNWDPNAPLYGKTSPRPAASGAVGTASTATPPAASSAPAASAAKPAVAPPVAAASAAKPAAAPAPKPSADPLGDLAKAKSGAAAPAGAAAEPFAYFVQAGAFRTPEDAEAQRAKVAMAGFDAKVTEREQSGRMVYRVRVGPIDKKDDVDKIKEKLDAAGFESAIVRVQR